LQTNRETFSVTVPPGDAAPLHTPHLLTGRGAAGLELRF
jgi:hypothetical protein